VQRVIEDLRRRADALWDPGPEDGDEPSTGQGRVEEG
jgi:hypothetical protein